MENQNESPYRDIFEIMQEVFFVCEIIRDENGAPRDFRYRDANGACLQRAGRKREEMVGHTYRELFRPNPTFATWLTHFDRVERTGEPDRFEQFAEATGLYFEVYASAPRPGQVAVLLNDISARKRAESQVLQSQARLVTVLNSMTDAVFISDAQGQFLEFNDAFATYHRFKSREECAKTFAEYPDILDVFMADGTLAPVENWAVPRALRGEIASSVEYTLRRKDTGEKWVGSYSFSPIRGGAGQIVGSVVTARDITAQKQAEMKLIQLSHLYATLSQVNEAIARHKNRGDLFQAVCDIVVQNGNIAVAWVGLLEDESGNVIPAAANGLDVARWPFPMINIHQGKLKDSFAAETIRSGRITLSADVSADKRVEAVRDQVRREGFHALAAIPLRLREKTIGMLSLISHDWGFFNTPEELHLLEEIGGGLSFALEAIQGEQERAENEKLVRQWADAFENCSYGIAIDLADSSTILTCNPAYARLQGRTVEEIASVPILSMYINEDHALVKRAMAEADRTGCACYETRMVRKDGSTYPVQIDLVSVRAENGKIFYRVATQQDISERREKENALRYSEAVLEAFFAHSPGILTIRDHDLRFIKTDQTTPWFYGLDRDSIVGKTVEQLNPHFSANFGPMLRRVMDTGKPEINLEVPMPIPGRPGEVSTWQNTYFPIPLPDGQSGIASMGFNISAMKEITRDLEEQEISYRSLFDHMLNGFAYCRMLYENGDPRDFIYMNVNENFENLTGLRNVKGKKVSEVIPGIRQSDPHLFEIYSRVALTGIPEVFEMYVESLNDWYAISVYSPQKEDFVAIFDVVTQRKATEERVYALVERLDLAARAARLGVWDWDILRNKLVWDERMYQLYGVQLGDFPGAYEAWLNGLHPDDRAMSDAVSRQAQAGEREYDTEFRVIWPDGSLHWIKADGQVIRDSAGRPIRMIGINYDITERKQAVEALRKSEQALRLVTENSQDVIWVLDTDSLYFTYMSPSVEKLRGYTPEEVMALPMDEALMPVDRASLRATIHNVAQDVLVGKPNAGEYAISEVQQPCKDGSTVWTEVTTHYYVNPQSGKVEVVGVTRDSTARHKAEEALRESEEKLRLFIDYAPASLSMFDNDMRYLAASRRWIHDNDLEGQEFLGKSHYTCVPGVTETWKAAHLRGLAGEVVSADEDSIEHANGALQWIKWEVRPWYHGDHQVGGIVIFSEDITERKQAADELRRSQESFSKLFYANPAAMAITSLDEGRFLAINEGYTAIMGYAAADVVGRITTEMDIYVHPQERQEMVRQLNLHGMLHNFEIEVRSKSGVVRSIVLSMERLQFNGEDSILSAFIDISQRKQAEIQIAALLEKLELAARAAHLGVWDWDIPRGVSVWDDAMYELYGIKKEAGPETFALWVNSMHPDDRARSEETITAAQNSKKDYDTQFRIFWPDGSLHWLKAFGHIVHDGEGRPLRMIGVNYDITDQMIAEEEILKLNSELEQRVKERTAQLLATNRELEAFAYSVSHDLRAPLRGIDGWSLALAEDYREQLDDKGRGYIDTVRAESQRMGQLIDDLLRLSRLTRSEMVVGSVDLSRLAQTITARLHGEDPERRVEFILQPGLTCRGDAHLLEIALTNLFSNAFKFTGKVPQARIEFGQAVVDGKNAYFIRDNGAGFNMAYAKNLFGAFQRMHRQSEFQGTGIGLATVQRIIHRHGGEVWAQAEKNAGATFYFTIEEAQ